MAVVKRWNAKAGKEIYVVDFNYRHPDGRMERIRFNSPVDTKKGAEKFERDAREELQAGTFKKAEAPKEVPVTFADFEAPFMAFSRTNNKPSAANAKEYVLRLHLLPFFGKMELSAIGPEQIEAYKDLKKGDDEEAEDKPKRQSPKSINNHLAILRKLLNLAVEYGKLAHAPKVKALAVGEQDFVFLDFEESEHFLEAAAPEWKPMLTVALKTGLRIGELLALKWEDIDLKARQLTVKRTLWGNTEGTPKGGKRREIALSGVAVEALQSIRHLKGPYVFCGSQGERLTHSIVKEVVPRACTRAGLAKRLTMHDLRHTFASHLVMRGRSLVEVQQLLGHSTIQMTMRYAHLSPDVKRAAVDSLDAPAPGSQGLVKGWSKGI